MKKLPKSDLASAEHTTDFLDSLQDVKNASAGEIHASRVAPPERHGLAEGYRRKPNSGEIVQTLDSDPAEDSDSPFTLLKAELAAADHATDFTPPIYNIWKQQEKTGGSKHFGNCYFDGFAGGFGGGSVILGGTEPVSISRFGTAMRGLGGVVFSGVLSLVSLGFVPEPGVSGESAI